MNSRALSQFPRLILVLSLGLAAPALQVHASGIRYYAVPNGGLSGCTTWATACSLRHVLGTLALAGDQVWVAEGVYLPSSVDQTSYFPLHDGVAVYGGFAGTETLLSQRRPALHITILSGDIGVPDDPTDNSDTVVRADNVGSSTILDGFTITAGDSPNLGAGIFLSNSSPRLRNLIITGNSAFAQGGGMYVNGGSPTLSKVTFHGNYAAAGGGMYNTGSASVKLTRVTFLDNRAETAGGAIFNDGVSPTLSKVTVSGNTAKYGGGIYNQNATDMHFTGGRVTGNIARAGAGMYNSVSNGTLKKVMFLGNTATQDGGGLYSDGDSTLHLADVTFRYNAAGPAYSGGGMYMDVSAADLTRVVFDHNSSAGNGGGLAALGGSVFLTDVTLSNNNASQGSGGGAYLASETAGVYSTTLQGDAASINGGGLYFENGIALMVNDTFNGNTAASGGALYNTNGGNPALKQVTISGNSATSGSAIYTDSGTVTLTHSIVWKNGAAGTEISYGGGSFVADHNTFRDPCPGGASCTATLHLDPKLGALAKNGGFTKTMALSLGSPAIDSVACLPGIKIDQRGIHRPQGSKCDMGAYEYVP